MDKYKIGSIEAIFLIAIVILNHIVLNLPKNLIDSCGNATPLNIIYITILVFVFLYFILKLFNNFKGKDILDISEFLGGKVLKTIIGILFIGYFIIICATELRNFGEILKVVYFPKLPICLLVLIFLTIGVIANKYGGHSIIKSNLIVAPLIMINLLVAYFCISGRFIPEKIFPILGYGVNETFFSGISNIFAFTGLSYIYFLQPILKKQENFKTISYIGIGISSLYLFLSVTALVLSLSDVLTVDEISPVYLLVRAANFGRFIQRADAIFFFGWILCLMSQVGITMLLISNIGKKTGNLEARFPICYAVATIIFIIALIPKGMAEIRFIENVIYKYYTLILVYGICFLILVLANIKYKKTHKINRKESDFANE